MCLTAEIALLSPQSPRPPLPHSLMYTGASVIVTQTDSLSKTVRLTYLSVYDRRDDASESVLSRQNVEAGETILRARLHIVQE